MQELPGLWAGQCAQSPLRPACAPPNKPSKHLKAGSMRKASEGTMPRAGKFLSRGLWEQPGPTTCVSSVPVFSHWITGPLTASGSTGEGAPPGVGGSPLPANITTDFYQGAPRTQTQTSYSKNLYWKPNPQPPALPRLSWDAQEFSQHPRHSRVQTPAEGAPKLRGCTSPPPGSQCPRENPNPALSRPTRPQPPGN